MAKITQRQAGSQNIVAFLDMLAWSEGTDNGRQSTNDHGYDVLVGGQLFTDYQKHPETLVALPKLGIKSSAAGRYQMLKRTWNALREKHGYRDFGPLNQDFGCIELIRGRGALADVMAGRFQDAVQKCRKEWASLPGAGYGQHEQKLERLQAIYVQAGGELAS